MSNQELNSLDDFQRFVSATIKPWSREQRTALAAAMAERWLPVYESFSEEEEWGDPSAFQRAIESVWNCALGHKLTSKDHRRLMKDVEENTPHMDDFDAEEVIATSGIIHYALNSCMSADNIDDTVMAMVSAFEGVAPGIYTDEEELPPGYLESTQFRELLEKQVKPMIDNAPAIDEQELDTFRQELMSIPVMTQEGVGPLPPDVWDSPQIREQMEQTLKLRNEIGNIFPMIAQQIEALRQEHGPAETDTEAEQASRGVWQLPQVQAELEKQLKLLKVIGDMAQIDRHQVDALRQKLTFPTT